MWNCYKEEGQPNVYDNVNKILVENKADMDESKRVVPTSHGQALADEYDIKFFESGVKTNLDADEVFFSIARNINIKQRLADTDSRVEPQIQVCSLGYVFVASELCTGSVFVASNN